MRPSIVFYTRLVIVTLTLLAVSFSPVITHHSKASPLTELPIALQGAISRSIGDDNSAYHVTGNDILTFTNPHHNINVTFDEEHVTFSQGNDIWSLRFAGVGDDADLAVPVIQSNKNRVEYIHGDLTEWYVNGPQGVQQGITIAKPPNDNFTRNLIVAFDLRGTLTPKLDGETLRLVASNGRAVLSYSGLVAFDAAGHDLPVQMTLHDNQLRLHVDDTGAIYPVTIDPFVQQVKLTASDAYKGDDFGYSVSVDGDTVVIGAPGYEEAPNNGWDNGAAYVFVKPEGGWNTLTGNESAKLIASDTDEFDNFGYSVSVNGDTIVVGAYWDNDNGAKSGSAYVFVKPQNGWSGNLTETTKLLASDGKSDDLLGYSVSVDGDTVVAGAFWHDGVANQSGAAYVYVEPQGGWSGGAANPITETAKLLGSDTEIGDWFGYSVDVSGNTIAVGAFSADNGLDALNSGSAYVFLKPQGGWTSATVEAAKLVASDASPADRLGSSISIDGDTIVVGAEEDDIVDDETIVKTGSAYVFVKPPGGWSGGVANPTTETAKLIASDAAENDNFGYSVSVSGDFIVVGAWEADNASEDTGSAYLYAKPYNGWSGGAANPTTEIAKLVASDAAEDDNFGVSVGVSGSTIVVGAHEDDFIDDDSDLGSGSAYVFDVWAILETFDVNNDNIISSADAIYIINRIGQNPVTDTDADIDNDGDIDEDDANAIIAAVGVTLP